ncbi:hypothetical protein Cantr_00476 [Candida viswanathii]|uniref:Uncharacterized protein n=1 Tax=Candida viswanathii TaxID=5486 RepID=A0A367YF18_9ASCO|nr:hypothetical protein Cantr_00476 [Candida viswanathii]
MVLDRLRVRRRDQHPPTLLVIDVLGQGIPSKIQALDLLSHLPALNKRLIPQLKKAVSSCLVHVPPITPTDESLALLTRAYPWVYKLDTESISTISTILSTLNSPPSGSSSSNNYPALSHAHQRSFHQHVQDLLALNQLIIGLDVTSKEIVLALQIQKAIIDLNHPFVSTYTYDFIGAWTILLRRADDDAKRQLELNVASLKKLVNNDAEIIKLCTYIN